MTFVQWMQARHGDFLQTMEDVNSEFATRALQFEHDKFLTTGGKL